MIITKVGVHYRKTKFGDGWGYKGSCWFNGGHHEAVTKTKLEVEQMLAESINETGDNAVVIEGDIVEFLA